MRLVFTENALADYQHWQDKDRKLIKRLNKLFAEVLRDPEKGIGKPERLRHLLDGARSRRINDEHRLVYLVEGDDVIVLSVRYHY
ncbi:MAG: Txe/YoeB family addiction module toxin [Pseudonocardiaceae bacterium]